VLELGLLRDAAAYVSATTSLKDGIDFLNSYVLNVDRPVYADALVRYSRPMARP